jgi:hypothetical protein
MFMSTQHFALCTVAEGNAPGSTGAKTAMFIVRTVSNKRAGNVIGTDLASIGILQSATSLRDYLPRR